MVVKLEVKLTQPSLVDLSMVARALDTSREVALEYVVRNTLKSYHHFDQGGYANMLDTVGNVYVLSLTKRSKQLSLAKLVSKLRRSQPLPAIKWEVVETEVSDDTYKHLTLSMSVYGVGYTTLINRLVDIGSVLAVFLNQENYQAFAYNSGGQAVDKIEFTP